MPTIEPLPDTIFDGNFDFPQEIEGSPIISTDEITKSLIVTRNYVVKASNYNPLPQGVFDGIYPSCALVNEQGSGHQGPLYFFTRVFAQLPFPRTEQRLISFTRPGRTGISINAGGVIAWNQYGTAAPNTRARLANVAFSYYFNSVPSPPAITQITAFDVPVDYYGQIYTYDGNVTVTIDGVSVVQPSWSFAGNTSPASLPSTWIQDVQVSRWRGNIWEMQVVSLNPR